MPPQPPAPTRRKSFWSWLKGLFAREAPALRERTLGAQEARVLNEFCRQYGLPFRDLTLLKLALTHRSYLSVTGQGPRESNERLEFLGDSVLGLVTSEFLYRRHPDEHEGQLTKTKSLLVSKAILSRRALRIGLGRFVLMSHSEVESGGRQRLSILADAFESVIGAVYLDQGFEPARAFITKHLLAESDAITSDKRHTNYKSHLQEYVQNAFRTHPVYRIRSEYGPDHSKHFMVEVMVGKRTLGEGRGHNKKEAEQAAARDALEKVEKLRRKLREEEDRESERPRGREPAPLREEGRPSASASPPPRALREEEEDEPEAGGPPEESDAAERGRRRRRSRRGGRRHGREAPERPDSPGAPAPASARVGDDDAEPAEPGGNASREAFETERDEAEPPRGRRDSFARPAAQSTAFSDAEPSPYAAGAPRASRPEPIDEPMRTPSAESPRPGGGGMAFGRGRRREPTPGAAAGLPAATGSEPPDAGAPERFAEERRVDVFATGEPRPPADSPAVVDVAAAEEEESDRDRDARIDEMERALESFGRRRPPDYGRRGRKR